jgi:hypothetical protein
MINRLPGRKDTKWVLLTLIVAGILWGALLVSRTLLGVALTQQGALGFAIVAVIAGIAIGVGGFFGGRYFVVTTLTFYVLGIVYLIVVTGFSPDSGWRDIISVIGFMFISVIGIGIGIIVQSIASIRGRPKLEEAIGLEIFPQNIPETEVDQAEDNLSDLSHDLH